MARAAFDTLKLSQKFRAMGMSEKQAEAQAEAMAEAMSEFADTLVTKDYLQSQLADIRSTQRLHSWMLGVLVVSELVPLLSGSAWS
jgi:hypothetical protein